MDQGRGEKRGEGKVGGKVKEDESSNGVGQRVTDLNRNKCLAV